MSQIINAKTLGGLQQTIDAGNPNHLKLQCDGTTIVTVTPEGLVFDVGTGGGGGSTGPAFSAYLGGTVPLATNGTNVKVAINTVTYDTDTKFNTSSFKFTPGELGIYHFDWRVKILGMNSGTYFITKLYKNGVLFSNGSVTFSTASNQGITSNGSIDVQVTAPTDYFELFVWNGDTQPKSYATGQAETNFNAHFVRSI
jgi:hypothetical protein